MISGNAEMPFSQPTVHHILFIESDDVQISKYGFLHPTPKSLWVVLDDESECSAIKQKLAELHKSNVLKLYVVSACSQDDEYSLEDVYEELGDLNRWPFKRSR